MEKNVVLIAGPTASGKSSMAIRIAQKIDGLIINADSLQVYQNWRVLTARPDENELKQAPHALYGHVGKLQEYSVGHWINDARQAIDNTSKTPIIVGGTGLYFGALLNGLSEIPAIPQSIRDEGNKLLEDFGGAWFRSFLAQHDPESYTKLDQRNPARLQRAYEVLKATGHGLAYWHARPTQPLIKHEETLPILLNWHANQLNERINARFDQMMEAGAVAECQAALREGFNPKIPSNRAIGAQEIINALDGKFSMESAIERSKILTHQYAKRQRTWFRSKMKNWQQVDMTARFDLDRFTDQILR